MIDTEIHNLFKVAKSKGIKPIDVLEALENNGRQIYLSIKEELLGLMVFEGIKENGDPSTYSVKKNVYQITPGSRVELWEALDRGEEQADLNIRISWESSPNKIKDHWIVRVSADLPSMTAIDYQDYCFLPQSLKTVSDPILPGSQTNSTVVQKKVSTSKATGRNGKTNPELHKIFWRAFVFLRDEDGLEPQYKQVWQAIYDDFVKSTSQETLAEHRQFDPKEHIETIDPVGLTQTTKLCWLIATAGGEVSDQGSYILHSLPKLLNRLKNSPPQI